MLKSLKRILMLVFVLAFVITSLVGCDAIEDLFDDMFGYDYEDYDDDDDDDYKSSTKRPKTEKGDKENSPENVPVDESKPLENVTEGEDISGFVF